VYAQGFADDGVAVVIGCFLTTLCEIMQQVLKGIERWCMERELSVNPSKTEMMLFTRRYKVERVIIIIIQHLYSAIVSYAGCRGTKEYLPLYYMIKNSLCANR